MSTQADVDLPKYRKSYPSRFRKGTLGYVLDQESGVEAVTVARKRVIESVYHKLEVAYKAGRKAGGSGMPKSVNPFEVPKSRSHSEHSEWLRGWRAVRRDARAAARMG